MEDGFGLFGEIQATLHDGEYEDRSLRDALSVSEGINSRRRTKAVEPARSGLPQNRQPKGYMVHSLIGRCARMGEHDAELVVQCLADFEARYPDRGGEPMRWPDARVAFAKEVYYGKQDPRVILRCMDRWLASLKVRDKRYIPQPKTFITSVYCEYLTVTTAAQDAIIKDEGEEIRRRLNGD